MILKLNPNLKKVLIKSFLIYFDISKMYWQTAQNVFLAKTLKLFKYGINNFSSFYIIYNECNFIVITSLLLFIVYLLFHTGRISHE